MIEEQPRDRDEDRLRFILEGQAHCDHFLSPLADPRGKSVLVEASRSFRLGRFLTAPGRWVRRSRGA